MVKRILLPFISLVLAISGAQAQTQCTYEDFEGSAPAYGSQEYSGGGSIDNINSTCSYPITWDNEGVLWCVVSAEGDEGGEDSAAHLVIRGSIDQASVGWGYNWGSCSSFTDGDVVNVKFRIKFDEEYLWGNQWVNKFLEWGAETPHDDRIIFFIKGNYWTAGNCAALDPNATSNSCTDDGEDCTTDADCTTGGAQYQCMRSTDYPHQGHMNVSKDIALPCAGPATPQGLGTGFERGVWYNVQYEVKAGADGYMKIWINNNNPDEPNSCTGSATDCAASTEFDYPAGNASVDTPYLGWTFTGIAIGNYINDHADISADQGFYLDDFTVTQHDGTIFDDTWYDGGAPACGDNIDNDGDGLIDYEAPHVPTDATATAEAEVIGQYLTDGPNTDVADGAPYTGTQSSVSISIDWDTDITEDVQGAQATGRVEYTVNDGASWVTAIERTFPEVDSGTYDTGDLETEDVGQIQVRAWAYASIGENIGLANVTVNITDWSISYAGDPGCESVEDTSEYGTNECDNGGDDDGDNLTDYPDDPGCDDLGTDDDEDNCGNGVIDGTEVCDSDDLLGGETCESQGEGSGVLLCSSSCQSYDTSSCVIPVRIGTIFEDGFESGDGTEWDTFVGEADDDLSVITTSCYDGVYCAQGILTEGTCSANEAEYFFADHDAGYHPGPLVDEVWLRAWVKYDSGYTFAGADHKLFNLNITDGLSWTRRYQVILYVASTGVLDIQDTDFVGDSQPSYHSNPQNVGSPVSMPFDVWTKVKMHFKMNTPEASDGIIKLWIDDVLKIEYTDANIRGDNDYGFNLLIMNSYTSDGDCATPTDGVVYWDGVTLSYSDPDDPTQYARPDDDRANDNGWTPDPNYWEEINEVNYDEDATYMASASDPVDDWFEVELSAVGDPVSSIDHIIRWRARRNVQSILEAGVIDMYCQLYQGDTQITTNTESGPMYYFYYPGSYELTEAEADLITNYAALALRCTADTTYIPPTPVATSAYLTQAYLEVPGASCNDGADNDGDGLIDYPDDPGCSGPSDTSELGSAVCDDGIDNDGDTLADYQTDTSGDPGCGSVLDPSEYGATDCDDGADNDGDGLTDLDDDYGCIGETTRDKLLDDDEDNCDGVALDPDGAEVCDGTHLDSETCESQGYDGGTLACASNCLSFDYSSCTMDPPADVKSLQGGKVESGSF